MGTSTVVAWLNFWETDKSKRAVFGKQNWRCGMNLTLGNTLTKYHKRCWFFWQQVGGHRLTGRVDLPRNRWRSSRRPMPIFWHDQFQCVGRRGDCDAAFGAIRGESSSGADPGRNSKYSNENFEGRRGEGFHLNSNRTWVSHSLERVMFRSCKLCFVPQKGMGLAAANKDGRYRTAT